MDPHTPLQDASDERDLFRPDAGVSGDTPEPEDTPVPQDGQEAAVPEHAQHRGATAHHRAAKDRSISWTASEFITHQKSFGWYTLLLLSALLLATLTYLITHDIFPTATVTISIILLGVYAGRQPQQQEYRLDDQGLAIGARYYTFASFRSFAVITEGAFLGIEFTPLQRFAMYTTVYFDPKDEEKIVGLLSDHLPMEEPRNSFTDNLMRRIRF